MTGASARGTSDQDLRTEVIAATVLAARRLAWTWVVLLALVELAILPALVHRPAQLDVDMAALIVTAIFALVVLVLPRAVLRWVDHVDGRRAQTAGQAPPAAR